MEATTLTTGTKVRFNLAADHILFTTRWFPKDGATGTVQRVFKNGFVAVAVDQLRNFSADGKKTLHVKASELAEIAPCPAHGTGYHHDYLGTGECSDCGAEIK